MQIPPGITVKGVEMTPLLDDIISKGISSLEKVHNRIISVRIALEKAQGRRQAGNPYRMRIDVKIPDRADIIVKRVSKAEKKAPGEVFRPGTQSAVDDENETEAVQGRVPVPRRKVPEEPLPALIRRTFDSARRELEKTVDKQRGEVKTPAYQQTQAIVEKIFRNQQYGFLRTLDGQQIYFHRNSVLHNHWERLKVGTAVRYTLELGEKGLQASTVEPVNKPGAIESHDRLHDLPPVTS
jgi:cold shock CspA family protein/ribosome-associated translation inhibitor RaiA